MSDPRFDAVAAVLQEYFDGLCHSDTQRLRRVFHPQAVYACATAEPAVILRMEEYFPIVDQRPSPASRGETVQERILSKPFTDLLTLIHVDGRWQIIAKVFHYVLDRGGGGARKPVGEFLLSEGLI